MHVVCRGFLSELGPFYPSAQAGKLQANPYTWTEAANIIFLESPAFVGWSYSNSTADLTVGARRLLQNPWHVYRLTIFLL